MIVPFRKGAALAQLNGPMIETKRLILRTWREADVAPNTAMLSDPETARYITADHKPVTDELNGWRNAAIMAGHWALHGFGMFVVEEKASGQYVGRVSPWCPPRWPGFEVGCGIAKEFRGKGYATEAASGGCSTIWPSIASFIASSPTMSVRGASRSGSARPLRDGPSCSAIPSISG
jgi:RimJ/RimL family protein N-acetyltransferase